jgi:O-acetyl-ADP-ribose deacetylase (regulator of RNase III)
MIRYIQGNLLDSDCYIIAHGVNCSGGFGSGVAGQIAEKWPHVKEAYLQWHRDWGWHLGQVDFCIAEKGKLVAHCATQQEYGREPGRVYVDYDAIKQVMETLKNHPESIGQRIAIPKISAGLAGGDWKIIEEIINTVFHDQDIYVYYL